MALFRIASDCFWLGLVLVWAGSVVAVRRDARARVKNPAATRAAIATAAVLPFVGAGVWFCVRPSLTREERRERRLHALWLERELEPPLVVEVPVEALPEPETQAAAA